MARFILIILGAAGLGIAALVYLLGGDDGPAYVPVEIKLAPREEETSILDMQSSRARDIEDAVRARFPGAPDDILRIAAQIANPDIELSRYAGALRDLHPSEMNAAYGTPHPSHPDYGHTLLREAILAGNSGAGAILVEDGADTAYNDNEMPFQALHRITPGTDENVWFPDYRTGTRFLRLWLSAGGDPDLSHPLYGDGIGSMIKHAPVNNLEGILLLLESGADPWDSFDVFAEDGSFLYRQPGYFQALAGSNRILSEVAFRIAREGHYGDGSEADIADLSRTYEAVSREVRLAEDEQSQATIWALSMALDAIHEGMGIEPGPAARRVMSARTSRMEGGFFLAPGELRSPDTFDQRATDPRQIGDAQWAGAR